MENEELQYCSVCGQYKPISQFYTRGAKRNFKPASYCKQCVSKYHKKLKGTLNGCKPRIEEVNGTRYYIKGCTRKIFINPNDESYLKKNYPNTTNQELADELGISKRKVERMANLNGWHKSNEFKARIIKNNYLTYKWSKSNTQKPTNHT